LESDNAIRRPKKSIVPIVVKKAEKKKAKSLDGEKSVKGRNTASKSSVTTSPVKTSTNKKSVVKNPAVKTSPDKSSTPKKSSAQTPAKLKAAKIAEAQKVAEPSFAPEKLTRLKKSVEKVAPAQKQAATKASKSSEASNGDKGQKTSRSKAPAAIQQAAPPEDSSFLGKAKAAVKKALGKSKSKD